MSERTEEERLLQSLEGFEKLIATADATTFISASRKIRYRDILRETRNKIKSLYARVEALEAAQTARVLTLEEMQQWEIKTIWDKNAVYVENVSDPGYLSVYDGRDFDVNLDGYGISWRCWTQRPTDEQREAVKWDE